MKPLNCCKGCKGFNEETNTFKNKLKCLFCDEYFLECIKIPYNEQKKKKGCSTCKHCERVRDCPDYLWAEECICKAGLECDTILFTVKDCPKWVGLFESEEE